MMSKDLLEGIFPQKKTKNIHLKVTPKTLSRYKDRAWRAKMSMNSWMERIIDLAEEHGIVILPDEDNDETT